MGGRRYTVHLLALAGLRTSATYAISSGTPGMSSDRWSDVEQLFHDALARDAGERAAFLNEACGSDEALRREVESLLGYAGQTRGFMQRSAIDVAAEGSSRDSERTYLLSPGAQLGPYTVTSILGGGGMGEVYCAHDARLDRDVAIKVLPERITRDPAAVERFSREARAASALNHPNIVTIHEIAESGHGRFIVMELVHGHTLRKRVGQPFTLDGFGALATQIARALAVAHVAGIVHRDVKPENIMVRDDGYVKLLDFGLARLADASGAYPDREANPHIAARIPVGTLPYMSPEQIRGESSTAASDVFSLGVVFYELVTGQRPFRATSSNGVMHAILSEPPSPPSMINPEITRSLDALIVRMLEKDAARRPAAAEIETTLIANEGMHAPFSRRIGGGTARHSVGRAVERAELRSAFNAVAARAGLLISVTGEAGIGKTTLVEDVLAEIGTGDRACRIGRGRCSERLAGTEAYLPWLEAFTSLIHHTGDESIARQMELVAPIWFRRAAMVAMGHDLPDAAAGHGPERMTHELFAFLDAISQDCPLVLFFDDVHWADASSVDLLGRVGARLQQLRVLLIVTYRPTELLATHHPFVAVKGELQSRGVSRETPLGFLTAEDIRDYLAAEWRGHTLPTELIAFIQGRTEGNPLFMTDLVRHLRQGAFVREEHGRWALTRPVSHLQRELPDTMRGMIERKIAQLSETDRRLLVAASVQGHEFESAVVARVLDLNAADVEERFDALEHVHAFIVLVAEHELPDDTPSVRYRFVHVLYQNALYASLRPTRRSSLSAGVAAALTAYHGSGLAPIASQLATLFEVARQFSEAAQYFLLAAQQAASMSAHPEVVSLARRGLHALARVSQTHQRAEQELLLQTILGPALMITGGHGLPEVEAVYKRARELCKHVGGTPQLFPVVWGLWHFSLVRAESEPARALAAQLLTWATRLDDPALTLLAHNALANTLWLAGEFDDAYGHATRAREIYRAERHHTLASLYAGHDPGVACRAFRGLIEWNLGWPDQALRSAHDAIALTREIGHRYSDLFALSFAAMLHCHRRDSQRARQGAEEAMTVATELGMAPWVTWNSVIHGWAEVREGQVARGMAELRRGIESTRQLGVVGPLLSFLAMHADACLHAHQLEEGLASVTEAMAITTRSRLASMEAELRRLQGELASDPEDQEACFQQAIAVARGQHARMFQLRAATSLSRLYEREGRRHDARDALLETYNWFTEGFDTADLQEASAILERLGVLHSD